MIGSDQHLFVKFVVAITRKASQIRPSPHRKKDVKLPPPVRVLLVVAFTLAGTSATRPSAPPVIEANDNRTPGGTLTNDTLKIDLVVSMARWYPEASDGPYVDVPAFSEEGKAPSVPGPLLRVPEGTVILATVKNTFSDSTLWVGGLATRPMKRDSVAVRPGEKHTFTFLAGKPGTYLYYATLGRVNYDISEREQLAGAFVVDARGARADDRILMINIYGQKVDSTYYENAVAINGKSWPYTERIAANIGDTLHWRVINGSIRSHPMHLHGFYFRIDSRGNPYADQPLPPGKRRLEVTEHMSAGNTMAITWSPDRPGNWLFHCHFVFHVNQGARLGFRETDGDHHGDHDADPMQHMAGLVIGINVTDTASAYRPVTSGVRKLWLFANERRSPSGYAMSYVLQRGSRTPSADSIEKPGMPIILNQHQPAQITVVNRTHAGTAVHWHGIELESFSDGVAGWSGASTTVAPMIAPNDSFVAHLLTPRTGTFIYHTHLNDVEQLTSGAYGPIIVLEPGKRFDHETDHIFTLGWNGDHRPPKVLINGDSAPPPMTIRYGKTHRLRFVNIGAAGAYWFSVVQDTTPVKWRPVAKDGAAMPADDQILEPARRRLSTGETLDAEWTPRRRGNYALTIFANQKIWLTQRIRVR